MATSETLATLTLSRIQVKNQGPHTRVVISSDRPLVFQKTLKKQMLSLLLHHQYVILDVPQTRSFSSMHLKKYTIRHHGKYCTIQFQGHRPLRVVSTSVSSSKTKTYHLTLDINTQTQRSDPIKCPIIVIDPGHGGRDPGTQSISGYHEKQVTLETARVLQKALNQDKKYDVHLTRTDDRFLSLQDRVAYAHKKKADLLISLHADSHPNPTTRGVSLYILSGVPSDQMTQALAAKENQADWLHGSDYSTHNKHVNRILQDLTQRESMMLSRRLAMLMTQTLSSAFVMLKPHYGSGAFKILQSPQVPSILIEMGCLSHPQEEKELFNLERQKIFAHRLRKTLDRYFKKS